MRSLLILVAVLGSLIAVVWCAKQVTKPVWKTKGDKPQLMGENRDEDIKQILADKYQKTSDKVFLKISGETPQFVKGSVKYDVNEGPGGMFLATKLSGKWEVVFDGNGAVDCQKMKSQYAFPSEILEGVCD